jgi:hypothetical protein
MPTTPADYKYYPAISNLIDADDLPEILSLVKDDIQQILDKIYFKDYQNSKSIDGSSAFYSLDVVSRQKLAVEIFGTGIFLVLNNDYTDDTISSFPITVFWEWEILKFVNYFKVNGFSFSIDALFDLGLELFNVTEEQALIIAVNAFVIVSDPSYSKFEQLVADINLLYGASIVIADNDENKYQELSIQVQALNKEVFPTIFALYLTLGDLTVAAEKLNSFFSTFIPTDLEAYIKDIIIPKARVTLELNAALEFPRSVLLPMKQGQNGLEPDYTLDASGNLTKAYFQFASALLDFDTATGFGYQTDFSGTLYPQYTQIGNTGLIISFSNIKLDLSHTTNIPEADAAGYPVDFIGLYVQDASIQFGGFGTDDPNRPSTTIFAKNLLIGTGGISGTIGIDAAEGSIHKNFGLFAVELDRFSMTFSHNSIVNSSISGKLTIPGFNQNGVPAVILIDAMIKDDGDFKISARPQTGTFPPITLPGVFELDIRALEVGSRDGHFYIKVAGKLSFIADLPVLGEVLPKNIEISKLVIWDDGSLEFDGGELPLPASVRLKIGPVNLEVSHMSLGPYSREFQGISRRYAFFGFDGMINTGNAGVNATGNGIKYYFTVDNGPGKPFDQFLSIDRMAIDITIPGNVGKDKAAFILEGYLSMRNPDPAISTSGAATEYTGAVSFSVPKLKLTGSAGMRLTPSVPSFVVDVGLKLASPILLGATGLGIYAFRGLIGQHYMPDKSATTPPLPDSATWWDYYKTPSTITHREGVALDKFGNKPGFSVGAGMSVATYFDSGLIFSTKLFLLLGLPDVFLIEGQAGILRSRLGLEDDVDPPFSAVIIIGDDAFRGNLSAKYSFPDEGGYKGDILDLRGTLDLAFFFNNASGWYINIGKDTPESERVQAKVLTLFQGYAYLMLSSQGVKAGAGVKFDFSKSFGPVQVAFGAFLNIGGFVSFKPVQIGGFIQVGGYAFLRVWKFKFGIAVSATLAVEAPHPFNIMGSFQVKLNLPWPIPDIKVTISLTWHFNDNRDALLAPVAVLQLPDPDRGYLPAVARNMISGESFQLNYVNGEQLTVIPAPGSPDWKYNFLVTAESDGVTIPLDSFIDIDLLKPVKPGDVPLGGAANQLPAGYTELLPPQNGISKQVRHEYALTGLEIYAWKAAGGGAWVPYHIYEAVTAIVDGNTGDGAIDLSRLKDGYWQFVDKDKFNKIRLLSQDMFSYATGTTSALADLDARYFKQRDVFCYETIHQETLVNWKAQPDGSVYPGDTPFVYQGVGFTLAGSSGTVKYEAGLHDESLYLEGRGTLLIRLPQPVASLRLEFGANRQEVAVNFITTVDTPGYFGDSTEAFVYRSAVTLLKTQQNGVVAYADDNLAIDVVRLDFDPLPVPDYEGDWVLGGHRRLPEQWLTPELALLEPDFELGKALLFATLFNRSFSPEDVLGMRYHNESGTVAQWALDSLHNMSGDVLGILSGSPWMIPGYYEKDAGDVLQPHAIYQYTGNADGFVIPYYPALKIENGSFSFSVNAVFDPYTPGISTLLSKIKTDSATGQLKGYALHLVQSDPGDPGTAYQEQSAIPLFSVWLTLYNGTASARLEVTDLYTVDGMTGRLRAKQYKNILVSVNRTSGKLDIYIDRVPKLSTGIPAELQPYQEAVDFTYLNQLRYTTEAQRKRELDNPTDQSQLISELQVLSDNFNKTIQPVWRPDTTFAVRVQTQDRVTNGNTTTAYPSTHIFGFKTAGPVGHFHQHSTAYQALAAQDRADAFKLASLKPYIDYNRSFPDAQGRYDLSKPVLYHQPRVRLFFTEPYINAMYANWDAYQNLPAVESRLELQLVDPFGAILLQQLQWDPVQEVLIDSTNVGTLPEDQQVLYYLNLAAAQGSCDQLPVPIKKRTQQGFYAFPDLAPGSLYTALFQAVYTPAGTAESVEVYRFSFKTSRYAAFAEQAGSFILQDTPGPGQYAIYRRDVAFSAADIDTKLKPLIDELTGDDPANALRYAVPFDRLVYGGLGLTDLEPVEDTVIQLVVNTDPGGSPGRRILGILIRNPESFNDPKLPAASLADTLQLTLGLPDGSVLAPAAFICLYSGDTSGMFVTNAAMAIPAGSMQLGFRYKIFNGTDYETEYEAYNSPAIGLDPYVQ